MAAEGDHPFYDLFKRFGESMNLPRMDTEALLESHRKNIEALEQAARIAAAGTASLMEKQRSALEQGMRDASEMAQQARQPVAPQQAVTRGTEWARRSFEAAVSNAQETAEILQKFSAESTDVLRRRIRESMEEAIRSVAPKDR